MCGQPGPALGEHDKDFGEVLAVFGGGREVATDRAELLGSGEGAQAAWPVGSSANGHSAVNRPSWTFNRAHRGSPSAGLTGGCRPDVGRGLWTSSYEDDASS